MNYDQLIAELRDQARIIGSSGKGWGKFAGINRKAASAISDLLTRIKEAERKKIYMQEKAFCFESKASVVEEQAESMKQNFQEAIIMITKMAEKAEKERDAAINQLHGEYFACVHYTPCHNEGPCRTCKYEIACLLPDEATDNWKWNGGKSEE